MVVRLLITLFAALLSCTAVAQTNSASILEDIAGTYTLTFTVDADPADDNPVANNARISFRITSSGRLCTQDLSSASFSNLSAPQTGLRWEFDLADVRFDVLALDTDPDPDDTSFSLQQVDFFNSSGGEWGRFTLAAPGDYSTVIAGCDPAADPTATQIDTFLDRAETSFASLFPEGPFTFSQTDGTYRYRYYSSTEIFLAVQGKQVYARGGGYGDSFLLLGDFDDYNSVAGINNLPRPATVPGYFVGTYQADMTGLPFSLMPDGETVIYAIDDEGLLCLSDGRRLGYPIFYNNNTQLAVWTDRQRQVLYRQNLVQADIDREEAELEVASLDGISMGTLDGERISLYPTCSGGSGIADPLQLEAIEDLFDLSEQYFPDLTPTSPLVFTRFASNHSYRYYASTNYFIAVRDGQVYSGYGDVNFAGTSHGTIAQATQSFMTATRPFTPTSSQTGSYEMQVAGGNPLSNIRNGERLRVVLAADGSLCVDNMILAAPVESRATPGNISWTNVSAGVSAALDATQSPPTLTLTSSRGEQLGVLSGNRVSWQAPCPVSPVSPVTVSEARDLFDLAEQLYPQWLPADSAVVEHTGAGVVTRLYQESDVTLSVVAGEVFVRGGEFGSGDLFVGTLTNLRQGLRAAVDAGGFQADLPATLPGSYAMTVVSANPFGPLGGATQARLVFRPDGSLCLNQIGASDPRQTGSASAQTRWRSNQQQLSVVLDTASHLQQLDAQVVSNSGNILATLSGTKISDNTYCDTQAVSSQTQQDINAFFELAERRLPAYFASTNSPGTLFSAGTASREYATTGITLSVSGNQVYARGGDFGSVDYRVGELSALRSQWLNEVVSAESGAAARNYSVVINGNSLISIAGLNTVNRRIDASRTSSYTTSQLADEQLQVLATTLLRDEIQNPDRVVISDIVRNGTSVTFNAQLTRTTRVGSSTTVRQLTVTIRVS